MKMEQWKKLHSVVESANNWQRLYLLATIILLFKLGLNFSLIERK